MRKLVYAINLSIDGCCDHTKMNGTPELHGFHANLLREADVLLYGRVTYQLMVPFWPDMAKNQSGQTKDLNDFANTFAAVDKIVVFSKTLEKAESKNTTILRGSLKEEILKLKNEPGKNILVGGVDLPGQLIHLGLVDEIHVVTQPTVVGEGRRLFDNVKLTGNLQLKLAESKVFPSGTIALHYTKQ